MALSQTHAPRFGWIHWSHGKKRLKAWQGSSDICSNESNVQASFACL